MRKFPIKKSHINSPFQVIPAKYFLLYSVAWILMLGGAFWVISLKHEARVLHHHNQELEKIIYALNTEWGQLMLEKSSLCAHKRVEKIAKEQLGLSTLQQSQVRVLTP